MLNKLENVSCKSFDDYTSKDELTKVNIFFGRNGSGKSSLSEWLRLGNEKSVIFNTGYLKNNIEQVEEIDGVSLVIGKESINHSDQIKYLNNAINNLEDFIKRKNNEITNSKKIIFNKMNMRLNEAREKFKISNNVVKQKRNADKDPVTAFNSWKENTSDIIKDTTLESLDELEERIASKEGLLNNIKTPILAFDYEEFNNMVKILMKEVIKPTSSVSYKVSEWIKDGLEIHNMQSKEETCEFCGNTFDVELVKENIDSKIKNEFNCFMGNLNEYKIKINESLSNMEGLNIDVDSVQFSKQKEELIKLLRILEDKEKKTYEHLEYPVDNWELINVIDNIINNYIENLKKEIQNDKKIRDSIADFVKSWIGKKLKNDEEIKIEICNINSNKEQIQEAEKCKEANKDWITKLKTNSSNLKQFSEIVNKRFEILDINIELEPNIETESYRVIHRVTKERLNLVDLSEGEKRLIGFLHFYYKLFMIADSEMKENIEYIIIDDPITSLDTENRYHLTKIINQFIELSKSENKQVFVFTHSSFDFHNFAFKGKNNTKETSHWYIEKIDGISKVNKLTKEELSNYSDYYRTVFNEVMSFALKGKNKVNKLDNYIKYANKVRFILESHARSHYKIEYATAASATELSNYYDIVKEKIEDIEESLDIINSLSHGISFIDNHYYELSVTEVQDAIRKVIGIIYNKDKQHVSAICSGVLNKENKGELQKWI
ncbi:AAA family ATPase [Staphylococcus caledonicus]|uniref:AAA family ATPase n=1 Tax=Staphylococcus caledonicus TaxID=2741333 RepID=UPI0018E43209|nr:AAA family ATPase [Staphylococcus caledonicus]MBI5973556.1 AAA family ATPase [Staphylococcus caledonicus]